MSGLPFVPVVLTSQRAAGTLYNTYTTAKSVINAANLYEFGRNQLCAGAKLRIKVWGGLSNITVTPGTITFQVMLGTIAAPIAAWSSGAVQLNATAHTLLPFDLEVTLRVDSEGSGTTAKLIGGGKINGIMFTLTAAQVDAVNTPGLFPVPATAPAVGTGFDSTIANLLDFFVGFSISNAANGIQVYDYTVEQLAGSV